MTFQYHRDIIFNKYSFTIANFHLQVSDKEFPNPVFNSSLLINSCFPMLNHCTYHDNE